jgi:hypothetical protein
MLRQLLMGFLAIALVAPRPAVADDYFGDKPSSTAVAVKKPRERTLGQRLTLYGLFGGAAIFAGVGVWAHLDSREASRSLEIKDVEPVETWTDDRQDNYDRAFRQRSVAGISYAISAGLLAGAVVFAYRTRPGYETVILEPTRGGAMVGGSWTW